jgi:hypothetical protein
MRIAGGWVGVVLGLSVSGGPAFCGGWNEVEAGLPRSPVGARTLVIDPSSPSTIYALSIRATRLHSMPSPTAPSSRARMEGKAGLLRG